MGAGFSSMLDRLLAALDAAKVVQGASATEARRRALDEAFAILGALYASLDSRRHPEMTAYLQFVYDACLQHIGGAGAGRCEGLTTAIALLSALKRAEEIAQKSAGPGDRPSFIARAIAV
jgi:flagellin-specific chaperone FliS